VRLGSTGLQVSRLCLGMMSYGLKTWEPWIVEEEEALPMIGQAWEAGINFWDTANMYSNGISEVITGHALQRFNIARDRVVIATKLRFPTYYDTPTRSLAAPKLQGPTETNRGGLSRKLTTTAQCIFQEIDASLKRLGTDYIDLYQIHRWDYDTTIEETMGALNDLVRVGKVRYIGASSMWAWQFSKAQYTARKNGWAEFVSMQNYYNLIYREEEREMAPLCQDMGVAMLPWSPLAGGALSGRNRGTTREAGGNGFLNIKQSDDAVVEQVIEVAKKKGVTPSQVALAWMLSKKYVTSPIVGITKQAYLQDLIGSLDVKLSAEEIQALEQRSLVKLNELERKTETRGIEMHHPLDDLPTISTQERPSIALPSSLGTTVDRISSPTSVKEPLTPSQNVVSLLSSELSGTSKPLTGAGSYPNTINSIVEINAPTITTMQKQGISATEARLHRTGSASAMPLGALVPMGLVALMTSHKLADETERVPAAQAPLEQEETVLIEDELGSAESNSIPGQYDRKLSLRGKKSVVFQLGQAGVSYASEDNRSINSVSGLTPAQISTGRPPPTPTEQLSRALAPYEGAGPIAPVVPSVDLSLLESHERDRSALEDVNLALRRELSDAKASLNRKIAELERDKAKLNKEVNELRAKGESLTSDRRFLYERQLSLTKKIEEYEASGAMNKLEVEGATRGLRNANSELGERLAVLQSDYESLNRVHTVTLEKLQSQVETTRRQRELDADRVRNAEELSKKAVEEREIWRARWTEAERKVAALKTGGPAFEIENLKRDLEATKAELTRARSLTPPSSAPSTTTNVALLHEQNLSLARRAATADALRGRVAALERELDEARAERVGWAGVLEDTISVPIGASTPRKVARALAETRARLAAMEERYAAVTADAEIKVERTRELEARVADMEAALADARASMSREERRRMREERSRGLAEKEVGLYRAEIKSYDQEDAMDKPSPDDRLSARNAQLEILLDEYRERLKDMETEMNNLELMALRPKDSTTDERTDVDSKRVRQLEDELTAALAENEVLKRDVAALERQAELTGRWRASGEGTTGVSSTLSSMEVDLTTERNPEALATENASLQSDIAALKSEVSTLTEKLDTFETQVARGAYNPETTRVLALKGSPAEIEFEARTAILDALRTENEALLSRLSDRSQTEGQYNSSPVDQVVPAESMARLKLEYIRLGEEKSTLATQIDRLKSVFKQQAAIMRETVYALFGWRLELLEAGRCRIKSPLFDGGMTFVPTSDGKGLTLANQLDGYQRGEAEYIGRCGSVAGFLAWVVLVGVHKQYGGDVLSVLK
ncbi:hypothetical protein HDU93_004098, partial [Gonapodya sp. JEL0774]